MREQNSLLDRLEGWELTRPADRGFTFLGEHGEELESLNLGQLAARVWAFSELLRAREARGERALLLFPPGLDFVVAFLGCLAAGAVAVPAYPPRFNRREARLRAIVEDATPRFVLTTPAIAARRSAITAHLPELEALAWLTPGEAAPAVEGAAGRFRPSPSDLAFLQYTSGSTATPKGVMVTHGNLLHNEAAISQGFGQSAESVVVGWLPLYHDMGLIGNVLQPLYLGARCVLMAPLTFLQHPVRWLEAISRYRATTSGGPNFAYELCAEKIAPAERQGLDLSSWTLAFSGAEPVRAATLERFARAFEPCGFRRRAFYPCYGLAEATLFASGGIAGEPVRTLTLDAAALEQDQAEEARAGAPSRKLVGCGRAWGGQAITVVDAERSLPLPAGRVGEIWLAGPSIAAGYWRREEQSAETFGARLAGRAELYLRTGDLGFFDAAGELYITGRAKDLLILRGRNHYPQDIEATAEASHPALRRGCSAAFSIEVEREERLVLVQEVERRADRQLAPEELEQAIRRAISEEHEVQVHQVVLASVGGVPKTSSGKVRRQATKALLLAGELPLWSPRRAREAPASPSLALPTAGEVRQAPAAERAALVLAWLRGELARLARLPLERCDPDQPLSALGLDSLLAVELKGRAEAELGAELSLAWLLEGPTLAEVAAAVAGAAPSPAAAVIPARGPELGEHPLSHGQAALWFLNRLAPSSGAYNIAAAVTIAAPLDLAALAGAFAALVERHPALRTTFAETPMGTVQRVHPPSPPELRIEDAAGWTEGELRDRLEAEAYRPFDLERGPLLRVRVYARGPREYRLLLALHHIVSDFWSVAVLARELGQLYTALAAGRSPGLPAPAALYSDWARGEVQALVGEGLERALAPWRERLGSDLPVLDLPADRPRPAVRSGRGASRRGLLPAPLAGALRRFAAARGLTAFAPLLAALQALLCRVSGGRRVIVGSPFAGRRAPHLAGTVGYFVNPLPLAFELGAATSFGDAVARARRESLFALEHQDLPLPLLARALAPEREALRSPLFQAMLVWQRLPPEIDPGLAAFAVGGTGHAVELGGLELSSQPLAERWAQFDLTLAAAEQGEEIALRLTHDAELWDGATAARFLSHFETFLAAGLAAPELPLLRLPILTAAERHQLTSEWNDTAAALPPGKAHLAELIAEAARRAPEAIAVSAEGDQLSRGGLAARAGQVAALLAARGVGPETRVGVLAERSTELLILLCGVFEAGACYLPLDPTYPAERLAWVLADAGAPLVLAQDHVKDRLPAGAPPMVALRDVEGAATSRKRPEVHLEDAAAYAIYTSGSTGRPKGVLNSHRGIVNRLLWFQGCCPLGEGDRLLQKTPISFDVSLAELTWPLVVGARLLMARPGGHRDPAYLTEVIARERITTIHFVASMLEAFLGQDVSAAAETLVRLISSGEAVAEDLFRRAAAALGAELWDLYGPTEAAIEVSGWRYEPASGLAVVPIGRPISNLELHIFGPVGEPAPVGVAGELAIGGVGVARGYLGRPALTAERFVPDSASGRAGARLYRTGDLARWLPLGAVDYLGRLDEQVKVRGVRIELGEITAALARHAAIAEAVVVLATLPGGERELAAYFVPRPGLSPALEELRTFLLASLPEAMVPWFFIALAELPRTASGKIDRKALPAPAAARAAEGGELPEGATEEALARIWAGLLGLPRLGRHENFFHLGGHSLLLTKLAARIRDELGVELPLARVFEAPTVAALAAVIDRGERAASAAPIAPAGAPERASLSFAQERLWFLDRLEPGSAAYNLPGAFRLRGELAVWALARAFNAAVVRQAALRTRFVEVGGRPRAEVVEGVDLPLPVVDLAGLGRETREREGRRLAAAEAERPFDLGRAPLLRLALLRAGAAEHWLLITQHHIATDGWSLGLLATELEAGYAAALGGTPAPLPKSLAYADYAAWQRRTAGGAAREGHLAYWREALAGAPEALTLPTDRPRPAAIGPQGGERQRPLPPALGAELSRLARASDATPFMAGAALAAAWLGRLAGQREVLLGTPVAGRLRTELEATIGLFVNTVVLRFALPPRSTFRDLLLASAATTRAALEHQELPFEALVEALAPGRSLARSPLFQVMFATTEEPVVPRLAGLAAEALALPASRAKFDLDLELAAAAGGALTLKAGYSTELFDGSTIDRWLGFFANLLRGALEQPDAPLAALPLSSAAERHQALIEWSGRGPTLPEPEPVERALARQAALHPDRPALLAPSEVWSYGAFAARVRELAGEFRAQGVGAETGVAIQREPGVVLLTSLFAVLEAGGFYVPIDPATPAERQRFMLEDSGAQVLVGARRDAPPRSVVRRGADAAATNLAYLIYTSGSTGRPKGVAVSRRCLAWYAAVAGERLGIGPGDRVQQFASVSFDASAEEIYVPLTRGAALVMSAGELLPAADYLAHCERLGVTVLELATAYWLEVVRELAGRTLPAAVRLAVVGGEEVPAPAVGQWRRLGGGACLVNAYGPTEATVSALMADLALPGAAAGAVSLGRPLVGSEAWVLDGLALAPLGVPGELGLGGCGLARGYLGRPALTAERFLPSPFSERPGARLYRTGDRARQRPDGAFEFLGRLDAQIKLRGFRVELGEIEARLREHPEVEAAAVLLVAPAGQGERQLVAYVATGPATPRPGLAVELCAFAGNTLPAFMVPSAVVLLPALPLTLTGKIDRKALPAPEAGAGRAVAAPRSPLEEALCGFFAEVLGTSRVGIHDSFFELGGHSLLATQVISRIRGALGRELPLKALFEAPTVAGLASRVEALAGLSGGAIGRAEGAEGVLSFGQERLWFLDRLTPGDPSYNIAGGLELVGPLVVEHLRAALSQLALRHEALRTVYEEGSRGPRAVVQAGVAQALPLVDLAALPAETAARELAELGARESEHSFDLAVGPLFRTSLVRLGPASHVLLLNVHHIAADGWSFGVMQAELAAFYRALLEGSSAALGELPIRPCDYAVWQRARWEAGELSEELAAWRAELAGAPPLLELPLDQPRPAVASGRGAKVAVRWPGELAAALHTFDRSAGATPFMTLLAAFATFLARLSGAAEVVVGTPIANRTRLETEGLVGFFVNTLALRCRLHGDPTFREAVSRVREATLAAYGRQEVPFEKLVAELVPERQLAAAPLFQVMLVLQNTAPLARRVGELAMAPVELPLRRAKLDWTLSLREEEGELCGELEYSADLFGAATVARRLAELEALLRSALVAPERRLSELALLTESERDQLLGAWAGRSLGLSREGTLHGLVWAQAAATPEAVAVVAGGEQLSYAALVTRAEVLAAELRAAGVGPEVRVGVMVPRGAELAPSLLGVLAAGGAYVPIDPAYPEERQRYMLEDSGAVVVVEEGGICDLSEDLGRGGIGDGGARRDAPLRRGRAMGDELGQHGSGDVGAPREAPLRSAVRRGADSAPTSGTGPAVTGLAYVIYTSGSTGKPKGVAIEHGSAVVLCRWAARTFSPAELSGVLAATSICFDLSVFELFAPLATGGTAIVAENALALPSLDERARVRLLNTVPSAAAELLRQGAIPAGVRTVNLAGEPLTRELAEALYATGTVERLWNLYGPSEDTTYSTEALIPRGSALPPSIGRPLPESRAYVVDHHGGLVPVGVPGELLLGGAGLSRGYLGRPALTAERYLPDGFGASAGARLYRTGDKVRWRDDGELAFLGRLDHQVKVRGFRIEPGEVEARLRMHPGVAQAVVVAQGAGEAARRLVAYVAPRDGAALSAAELKRFVGETLPEHMVPSVIAVLAEMPLTLTGKIDRKALPAPEAGAGRAVAAPRSPLEEALCGFFAEVLGASRVGIHDSFFELGGHSLLATQVISRIRGALGRELPLKALFEAPTVAGLASRVEALAGLSGGAIGRAEGAEGVLSFGQERLWFLDRLTPGDPSYNIAGGLELVGPLVVEHLRAALSQLALRHEALRTVYEEGGRGPRAVVQAGVAQALPLVDLAALPAETAARELAELGARESEHSFDLAVGPLFRTSLVRLGPASHVLLLNVHHIAADGWSFGVMQAELAAFYRALLEGSSAALGELPIRPCDYAVWQRARWEAGELSEELAAWRAELAGAPPLLELPLDQPRPAVASGRGAKVAVRWPGALAAALHTFDRSAGATPFMTLLAAFATFLARLSGAAEVVVGTPIANRTRLETEGLVGFFVNTLALRCRLHGDPTFREAVSRVREATLLAYGRQEVPFEKLVAELAPERQLAAAPLFQVMLVLQNTAPLGRRVGELAMAPVELPLRRAKLDWTLSLREEEGELCGELEYSADLFGAATVARRLAELEALLRSALAAPERRLSELALLTESERDQLLGAWAGRSLGLSREGTLHGLVWAQAAATPEAVAVVAGGEQLSYAALVTRAEVLAAELRAAGVGPEVRVGVMVPRGAELAPSLLGVLAAGGAYVPIDPAYPEERQRYMLEDSGATVVVDEDGVRAVVADAPPPAGTGPGATGLAYVIYTSGSTGKPKGVAIEHGSAVVLCRWAARTFSPAELSGVLAATSICFDLSVFELFAPLATGGTAIVAENALALPSLDERARVRLLNTVPSAAAELLRQGAIPAGVRTVNLAGEPLTRELAEALYATGTVERLWNLYGPSEDTTYSTEALIPRGSALPPSIGRPLPESRAYVVDHHGGLVPVGVPGELLLGGAGLSRGYLGRPALTAERYLPDGFGASAGARLYRTGDKVRWRDDGELAFLGRLDHQVKVRGFRIEPGEVEARLRMHPGVAQAVVVAQGAGEAARRLVAYVAPRDGAALSAAELKRFVGETLPEHMVPSVIAVLAEMPLTLTGKIDRKALPAPEAGAGRAVAAPRSPLEEALCGFFAEVLGASRVGIHDSFFELGGHSLLATQVISRIRGALGRELPLKALFEAPTVAGLAARVEGEGALPVAPPLVAGPRPAALPLSFSQLRQWLLDRLAPGDPGFNIPGAFELGGALDVGALVRSLHALLARHESLRTVFAAGEGEPVQRVLARGELPLPVLDLQGLAAAAQAAEERRLLAAEADAPFDLCRGPLLRARLLRLAGERAVLTLNFHHIIADGWSLAVFLRELGALYGEATGGPPAALPPQSVQYADVALWQRAWLTEEALAPGLAHWRQALAGAPAQLSLPFDRPRPAVRSSKVASLATRLETATANAARRVSRERGTTLFMTLLAGLSALLGRLVGQADVPVGTYIAGRGRQEVEGVIGFFINTLVLRTRPRPGATFAAHLAAVREVTLAAYAHQEVPFEQVIDAVRPDRDLSTTPLFQVMCVLQNTPGRVPRLGELAVAERALPDRPAHFDLTLWMWEEGEGIAVTWESAADLFDPTTSARMAGGLARLLAAALAAPERRLADLPLLAPAERHQLLAEWGRSPAGASAPPALVHEALAQSAARSPHAIAVEAEGEALSYGALDAASDALAARLAAAGAGPEVGIAVSVSRSPLLIVSLYGVLKSGSFYVPIDPAYPAERRRFMQEDSGAMVLIGDDEVRGIADAAPPAGTGPAAMNLAYVIYTSGSTGRPKGVGIAHSSLAWYTAVAVAELGITAADRVLQFASVSFDASAEEIYPCLSAGATLVLRPSELDTAPAFLARARERALTVLDLPTAYWHELARVVPEEAVPPGVRLVVLGGEEAQAAPVAAWLAAVGAGQVLLNTYGPTESTIVALRCRLTRRSLGPAGVPVPIGRPIPGLAAWVLAGLEPAPLGVPGELYLAGRGLARGYLGRAAATAERFRPCPFGEAAGERMYATGDRVRCRADGNLEFLGRFDDQVKVRGFRIELGEIEAALLAAPGVERAVVLAKAGAGGDRRLVAYVAGPDLGPAPGEALRAFLRQRLPPYMVPAAFAALPELPLTVGGKIDRERLPEVAESAPAAPAEAPQTTTEAQLARIWCTVLGRAEVGRGENFFELGGDSILGIQIIAQANRAGLKLSPQHLFQHQTVAELAAVAQAAAGPELQIDAEQGTVVGEAPLTPYQRWFFEDLAPLDPAHWNMAVLLELRRPWGPGLLARSVAALLAHHDALRTRFPLAEGGRRQVVPAALPQVLRTVDLSRLAPAAASRAQEALAGRAQAGLDLEAGPLVAALAFQRGGGSPHQLLFAFHHLVVDVVSWRLVLEDFVVLCDAYAAGRAPALPPKSTSTLAWARRLAAFAASPALAAEIAATWLRPLPAELCQLPADFAPAEDHEGLVEEVVVSLSEGETAALLTDVPRAYNTQINDALLAALGLGFRAVRGGAALLVALEGHGREALFAEVDLSRTAGCFTSVFPVVVAVPAGGGPGEALVAVKEELRSLPHHGIGCGVARYLAPDPALRAALAARPVAPLSFNYVGRFDQLLPAAAPVALSPEPTGPIRSPRAARAHALEILAGIEGGCLVVKWLYSRGRNRRATIEALAESFRASLALLIAHCAAPGAGEFTPSDFELAALSQGDLDDILAKLQASVG